ncbi:NADH-quinone oxidoreductase subunit C [Streptomyces sp. H51]|uniref:NADH-quinone oxidoreductase subunit C n=1 Tax=Streptomyces sp. H51 TaxID=3111770 RepID=UPI002D78E774|nr:NADH-quinone oxidoreductase subunit C [Streptomyces sp. H51]
MSTVGWLPAPAEDLFGAEATAEEAYDVLTVDVPPSSWISALETARTTLSCTYFDWLSAVDEPGTGFRVSAHVVALSPVRRLLLRTTVPHEAPVLPSAVDVYAGAAWHERETHEMFGVAFEGHPALDHLLLPENFEGHPLRKDFVLAARVAKAWPGAKEPGESEHGGPKRRQMLPPGVPDPNEWGPLKGQLPPAPARPARGAGRAAGERPVRRTRSAAEGSVSQAATGSEPAGGAAASPPASLSASPTAPPATPPADGSPNAGAGARVPEAGAPAAPRRARSASEGSASQRAGAGAAPAGPRRARSASEGSAGRRAASGGKTAGGEGAEGAQAPGAGDTTPPKAPTASKAPRSPDAPWHHARPAFDEPENPTPEAQAPGTPDAEGSGDKGSDAQGSDGKGSGDAPVDSDAPMDSDASAGSAASAGSEPAEDVRASENAQAPEDRDTPTPDDHPAGGPQ